MTRNQSLDILRGVAILLVLCAHSFYSAMQPLSAIGGGGVALFFVLSGFLISGLLFSEYQHTGKIDVARFWIRRGFKIYPAFYVLLVLNVVVRCLLPGPRTSLTGAVLTNLVFLQNYVPRTLLIPQSWSLAVEEHFYFLLPLLLVLLIRAKRLRWIPWITLGVIVLCTYLRMRAPGSLWHETHVSMDALFVGVGLGYVKHCAPSYFPKRSRLRWLLVSATLLLPVFVLSQSGRPGPIAMTVQFLGYAALLLWMVPRQPSSRSIVRVIAWVGRYSYSIYLWHLLALVPPLALFDNTVLTQVCYFAIAIALGVGMAKLVELPALRLRDKFFPALMRRGKPPSSEMLLSVKPLTMSVA
jgi:peptidoglycan/LPS O-acetylase OafA/YrhL